MPPSTMSIMLTASRRMASSRMGTIPCKDWKDLMRLGRGCNDLYFSPVHSISKASRCSKVSERLHNSYTYFKRKDLRFLLHVYPNTGVSCNIIHSIASTRNKRSTKQDKHDIISTSRPALVRKPRVTYIENAQPLLQPPKSTSTTFPVLILLRVPSEEAQSAGTPLSTTTTAGPGPSTFFVAFFDTVGATLPRRCTS